MSISLQNDGCPVQIPVPPWDLNFFAFLTLTKKTGQNINESSGKNHNNCSRKQRTLLFYYYL